MSQCPLRSPRQVLAGWVHLARFVDKVRLHHAGKLPADYQANFCGGFDGRWLEAAGVSKETFLEAVRAAKDDAAVGTGMVVAARVSQRQGRIASADLDRLVTLVARAGLRTDPPALGFDRWKALMGRDKKVAAGSIRYILLDAIGHAVISADVDDGLLRELLP